jgi:hypothetical protein
MQLLKKIVEMDGQKGMTNYQMKWNRIDSLEIALTILCIKDWSSLFQRTYAKKC